MCQSVACVSGVGVAIRISDAFYPNWHGIQVPCAFCSSYIACGFPCWRRWDRKVSTWEAWKRSSAFELESVRGRQGGGQITSQGPHLKIFWALRRLGWWRCPTVFWIRSEVESAMQRTYRQSLSRSHTASLRRRIAVVAAPSIACPTICRWSAG